MAIDAMQRKAMAAGIMLTAKYKGAEYTAEVVTDEDGKTRYRLTDGREFKSPSAAASAVMSGPAANGWRFWSVAGEHTETAPKSSAPATLRPTCTRCGKSFVGASQLAHHEANADRLCTPE